MKIIDIDQMYQMPKQKTFSIKNAIFLQILQAYVHLIEQVENQQMVFAWIKSFPKYKPKQNRKTLHF
jgi:hypothetical protein